jgi:hypothetical protein
VKRSKYPIFLNQSDFGSDERAHINLMEKMKSDQSYIHRLESAEGKFESKPEILQSSIIINRLTGRNEEPVDRVDLIGRKGQHKNMSASLIITNKNLHNLYEGILGIISKDNEKPRFFSERDNKKENNLSSSDYLNNHVGETHSQFTQSQKIDIQLSKEIQNKLPQIMEKSEVNDLSYLGFDNSENEGSFILKNDSSKTKKFLFFEESEKMKVSFKLTFPALAFESEIKKGTYDFDNRRSQIKLENKSYGRFNNSNTERGPMSAVFLGNSSSYTSFTASEFKC